MESPGATQRRELEDRLEAAASRVEIQQLAVRYAQALDARDLDALVSLWVPDALSALSGKAHAGEDGVRSYFEPILQQRSYRSIHMILGHRVDLLDAESARGKLYCRAERESGREFNREFGREFNREFGREFNREFGREFNREFGREFNRDWVVQAIVYEDEYRRVNGSWRFAKRHHRPVYASPIDPVPAAPVDPSAERRLGLEDRLEIHEMAGRYGIAIDDRDWPGLASVFTDDALFVTSGFPGGELRLEGLAAIQENMRDARHPVAHHVTNVVVSSGPEGVTMRSKVIGPGPRGRVGSADYRDRLRLTSRGWRIAERVVTLRKVVPPPAHGGS